MLDILSNLFDLSLDPGVSLLISSSCKIKANNPTIQHTTNVVADIDVWHLETSTVDNLFGNICIEQLTISIYLKAKFGTMIGAKWIDIISI